MTDEIQNALKAADAGSGRIRELERLVQRQADRIEELQKSRWRIPEPAGDRGAIESGESYTRLIIPDTHGCKIEPAAWAAMLSDVERLGPAHVIWLGDHLECGGFLAKHHTLGYVHQAEYTFEQDVDAANDTLDQLAAAAPNAVQEYLEGNHERRIEVWCVTQAAGNAADAEHLRQMFSVESQLNLERRGIHWFRQGEHYDGCRLPATIRRGRCYFTHGHSSAKFAADVMLKKFGACVVFGHIHRSQEASANTVSDGVIKAWCPGCLCTLQPAWRHTSPTDWSHGYAVQFVSGNGDFLHLNIPIIGGRSLLSDFLGVAL